MRILYLFGAAGLHGAWNSLALLSSFSAAGAAAAGAAEFQPSLGSILSVAGMVVVFGAVLFLVLRINKNLRKSRFNTAGQFNFSNSLCFNRITKGIFQGLIIL